MFNESFWVATSILIFIVVMFKYIKSSGNIFLENKISSICNKLNEAESLSREALELLNLQQEKNKNLQAELKEILNSTKKEIVFLVEKSEKDFQYIINHKEASLKNRLINNEERLLAKLRLKSLEIAIKGCSEIITQEKSPETEKHLLNQALTTLNSSFART